MTISSGHPSEDTLLALACGEADGPLRLLLETHLLTCAGCGERMLALSLAGGAYLASLAPVALPEKGFEQIWARVEALPLVPAKQSLPHLPTAIAAQVQVAKPWRWSRLFTRGMENLRLQLDPQTGSALYLIHLRPGCSFPLHRHRGGEDALVLAGGCQDGVLRLDAGDWISYPAGSTHAPVGDPVEGCWILSRVEGDEVDFHGWRGLLQSAWEGLFHHSPASRRAS